MNKRLHLTPAFITIVVANLLPVYWTLTGRLIFFQVMYLYWVEGFVMILFNVVKICIARGNGLQGAGLFKSFITDGYVPLTFFGRVGMSLRFIFFRVAILLFYGIFLFVFIGFTVTDKGHSLDVVKTIAFRNEYFNFSLIMFIISNATQLIGGFLISGQYKLISPRAFTTILDGRTLMLHVMIVSVVFIHQFLFEGKSYAAMGEVAYVALFMLVKTIGELYTLNSNGVMTSAAPANG